MNIYIDPADELNTIVHRVRLTSEANLVLILPQSCQALRNRINLQLLANYAKEWEKKLALQTDDPIIVALAEEVGLAVLTSPIAEAAATTSQEEQGNVKKRRSKSERKGHRLRDRIVVLLLIVAALVGIVYFNAPQAQVVVSPASHRFQERILFKFSQLGEGVWLETTSVNITRRTPATGVQTVGISHAQGVVVLLNQSHEDIVVPAGTVVSTGNQVSFRTLSEVVVPKVATEYFMDVPTGLKSGRAEVPIESLDAGQRGNVSAGRVVSIPGFQLEVRNPESTYGGQETRLTTITAQDVARAKEAIERDARQLVVEGLQRKIDGGFLLNDTIQLQIKWEDMSDVGKEAEEAFVTGIIEGSGYQANPTELTERVLGVMEAMTPEGFFVRPGSLELTDWEVVQGEEQQLVLEIRGAFQGIVEAASFAQHILGLSLAEVALLSDKLPHISQVVVQRSQGNRLPRLSRWIEVLVHDE